MATFWASAAGLTLVALAFLLVPLWRESRRSGTRALSGPLAAIAVAPVAIGLYLAVTTFDPDAPSQASHDDFALLDQLAARLANDPSDVNGWVLLGRSYMELGDYGRAQTALQEAWNRTPEPDDNLKMIYAQTLLFTQEGAALGLAGQLVEEVLQAAPNNEAALFWGGFVAAERNDPGLAAQRWTDLLATNPPPEIADLVRNQLSLLTGRPIAAPATAPSGAAPTTAPAAAAGPVIELDVSVADSIPLEEFGPNARVFILARGKDSRAPIAIKQPPPPLSALPGRFSLSDADAIAGMAAGRSLAQLDEVTVIARISASGQASEQSGDAYAEVTVDPKAGQTVSLVIDRLVP
jgi:cytochrome c-type biogenesis protein CcmH